MNVIDLDAQQQRIADQFDARMARVLAHGQYLDGPEVRSWSRSSPATSEQSARRLRLGSDALLMALMTLGVGPVTPCSRRLSHSSRRPRSSASSARRRSS